MHMLEKQEGNNMALRLEWTTIELSTPAALQQALSSNTSLKQDRLHRCIKTLLFINDAQELIYHQLALIGISSQWHGFKTVYWEKQWLEARSEDANSSHQEAQNSWASDETQALDITFSKRVTSSCKDLELALPFRCLLRFTPHIYGCKNTKIIVTTG